VSLEYAKRSGSAYRSDPNRAFYSTAALVNAPATLADLRKHDVAGRAQWSLKARGNFIVARDMDLAVSGRHLDNDYDASYGRLGERVSAFNIEWNWHPRPAAAAYAHYGFERRRQRMAQIGDDPAGWATGNPNAGGAAYPLANRWWEESRDDAHTAGFGLRYTLPGATLESSYAWIRSPYRARYRYASPGALAGGAAAAVDAGDGMPDMLFRQQALETSLRFTTGRSTALRLFHRYERTRIEDWHYDGLPLVLAGGAGIFLDSGPRGYSGHVVGVFFQYAPGKRP
jgi:hypothetical protein